MANIDFIRGQLSKIDERPVNDGNILLATNTGQLFIDAGGSRISISSVVVVDTLPESTQAKQDILYYAKDTNYLHHYNGNNFDIVNIPSTGEVGQVLKKTLDGIEFGLAEQIAEKRTQKPISFQVTGIDGEDFTIEFTEESGSNTPINADTLGGKPASDYVTKNITINEKPLSGDITLNANDVGARADDWMPTATDVGADPAGSAASALSDAKAYADGLTAADVGAIPTVSGSVGQFLGFTSANVVGAVDAPSGGAGKRACRFVIGTSTAGWTEDDCDYLCDGTSDQVEINSALQALPDGGGEIVILDGTYNIGAEINLYKNNITIRGCGSSTILDRKWFLDKGNARYDNGIFNTNGRNNIKICNLFFQGHYSEQSDDNDSAIVIDSSNNILIKNCLFDDYNAGVNTWWQSDAVTNVLIESNWFLKSGLHDIDLDSCDGVIIRSNIIVRDTLGGGFSIDISDCKNFVIDGNIVVNRDIAISVDHSGYGVVSNNLIRDFDRYGVLVNNPNGAFNVIIGNTVYRGSGAQSDYESSNRTIYIENNAHDNLIIGNMTPGMYPGLDSTSKGNTFVNNKVNSET